MPDDHFTDAESPDHPGWRAWSLIDPTRFNTLLGPLLFRIDGGVARLRMTPGHRHSNLRDRVHGGALLGFIDVALFAAARGFGLIVAFSATVRKSGNDQEPYESHPHPSAATPLSPSPTGRGKGPARGASGKGEGER